VPASGPDTIVITAPPDSAGKPAVPIAETVAVAEVAAETAPREESGAEGPLKATQAEDAPTATELPEDMTDIEAETAAMADEESVRSGTP
jgi:hypothetical protein